MKPGSRIVSIHRVHTFQIDGQVVTMKKVPDLLQTNRLQQRPVNGQKLAQFGGGFLPRPDRPQSSPVVFNPPPPLRFTPLITDPARKPANTNNRNRVPSGRPPIIRLEIKKNPQESGGFPSKDIITLGNGGLPPPPADSTNLFKASKDSVQAIVSAYCAVCPRSSDQYNVVSYYIKWDTTS